MKIKYLNKIKPGRSFQINTATGYNNHRIQFAGLVNKTSAKIININAFIVEWQIPDDPSPIYA